MSAGAARCARKSGLRWRPSITSKAGSWQGIDALFAEYAPARGLGQGRGRGLGQQGQGNGASDQRILVIDATGRIAHDTWGELIGQPVKAQDRALGAPVVVDGQTVGTLLVTTGDLSGHSDLERRFLETVNRAVVWAVLLVVAASLIAAALLSRWLAAPLRQLTAAAEAMAGGDLSQRVEARTRDEAGDLARAFNRMAGDLQAAEVQRQQMTADIAHELRNPLSVVRGNLEAMFDGVYPVDVEHLEPIYQETILLQRLVEDLRLLSLADAGQLELIRSDVDVQGLLAGVAEGAQAIARDKGITLRVETPPGAVGRRRRCRPPAPGPGQPVEQCPALHPGRGRRDPRRRHGWQHGPLSPSRTPARASPPGTCPTYSTAFTGATQRAIVPRAARAWGWPSRGRWSRRTGARCRSRASSVRGRPFLSSCRSCRG